METFAEPSVASANRNPYVHEYDTDYSRDLAELLPYALKAKDILNKSETLTTFLLNLWGSPFL